MTFCECGCGKDVKEGSRFLQGHYSTWLKKQKEVKPEIKPQYTLTQVKSVPWYMCIFRKKSKPVPIKVPIEDILNNLPDWSIKEKAPWFMSKSKKQRLIQFAGFSRKRAPVFCWVLYNGIYISVGDVAGEERLYEPPHAIHGNVFPYDLDRKRPLLDNAVDDEDAHESLRMGQVKNMAYTLARIKAMQGLFDTVTTLYILVGISILMGVANMILLYSYTKDVPGMVMRVNSIIGDVTKYMAAHP